MAKEWKIDSNKSFYYFDVVQKTIMSIDVLAIAPPLDLLSSDLPAMVITSNKTRPP